MLDCLCSAGRLPVRERCNRPARIIQRLQTRCPPLPQRPHWTLIVRHIIFLAASYRQLVNAALNLAAYGNIRPAARPSRTSRIMIRERTAVGLLEQQLSSNMVILAGLVLMFALSGCEQTLCRCRTLMTGPAIAQRRRLRLVVRIHTATTIANPLSAQKRMSTARTIPLMVPAALRGTH